MAARVAGIDAQRSDDGWVGGQQGGQHPALGLRRGEVGLSGLAARGSERGHVDEMGEQLWRQLRGSGGDDAAHAVRDHDAWLTTAYHLDLPDKRCGS